MEGGRATFQTDSPSRANQGNQSEPKHWTDARVQPTKEEPHT